MSRRFAASLYLGLFSAACLAGSTPGEFSVSITLVSANTAGTPANYAVAVRPLLQSGGCIISQTLSEQTNAVVRVACRTGQFVSIAPQPGKPFLGAHGGAFRYHLGGAGLLAKAASGGADPYVGLGTVTALRIFSSGGSDEPVEMLVSF